MSHSTHGIQNPDVPEVDLTVTPRNAPLRSDAIASATAIPPPVTNTDPSIIALFQVMNAQLQQNTQWIKASQVENQRLITTLANKDDNKLPSIPHIQADENLEAELVRFEHVMVNYNVSKDKWPSKLYPILTGKALDIYLRMPPTDTASYAAIKDALLLNAGITPENKLQELLLMNAPTGQTAMDAYGRIKGIFQRYSQGMTIEQFVNHLSKEVVFRLAAPHITSFVRALHLSEPVDFMKELDQYILSRHLHRDKLWQSSQTRSTAYKHQFHTQHISQPHTMPQSYDQSSPYSLTTPLLPNPGAQEMSMTESHQQNNLQTNKHSITRPNYRPLPQFDQNDNPKCHYCHCWGHMKKDCPKKIGIHCLNVPTIAPLRYIMATMNGKPVRALLDGGASCSAVWAPLVPPPPKDALRYASSGVHSDGEHSLTSITVTAGGKTHTVPALVFDDAKVDLLIGLNHPDFDDLWEQAKRDQQSINAVFTRQQTREIINEDNQLDDQQKS